MTDYGYDHQHQAEYIPEWSGEEYDWDAMIEAADSEEDFIVDGVISSDTTLLYGESKTGKSYLVCALIAAMVTGDPFLGREIEDRPWKIAILGTDDKAQKEYGKRIRTVLPDEMKPAVKTFPIPIMRSVTEWKSLHKRVLEQGYNFVVIDSMTQTLNGTINDDKTIREFFDGVRLFVKSGIPVLVIAHSSEKTGINGKSDLPLGSSTITQSVRHRVFAYQQNGRLFLKFKGNHLDEEYRMTLAPGAGARYTVLEEKSLTALAEENAKRKAEREAKKKEQTEAKEQAKEKRATATLDRNAQIVEYVITECQGMKAATVAKKVAEKFGLSVSTCTTNLSRGQSFGRMLSVDSEYRWTKTEG
ncbi:AAA family ATPase [Streptomyces sp. NPDC059680]|uniref:AAA family ATPase n=1 Tax=Streptomyces sp. NPDC059680 TaxID=3346904 RepID=UPI0036951095